MTRVIINADDLGISHTVNSEIHDALRHKHITSSTILANTALWNEVHEIINEFPDASFGVHLNLTEGPANTHSVVFLEKGVVDENNYYTGNIRKTDLTDSNLQKAIFNEWDAQISKVVLDENIHITHIDGHHHIHADYQLCGLLIAIAKKWNIKIVRSRYNFPVRGISQLAKSASLLFSSSMMLELTEKRKNRLTASLNSYITTNLWRKRISEILSVSEYFDSYQHFCEQLKAGCHVTDNDVVELMCHPGHPRYHDEYRMVCRRVLDQLVKAEYANYKNL